MKPIDLKLVYNIAQPGVVIRLTQSPTPHELLEVYAPGTVLSDAEVLTAWAKCSTLTANGHVVTATINKDVASVDLLIGAEPYTLSLIDCVGSVEIVFSDGVLSRIIKFADSATYGTAEITVNA